jgi:hypothetical protein
LLVIVIGPISEASSVRVGGRQLKNARPYVVGLLQNCKISKRQWLLATACDRSIHINHPSVLFTTKISVLLEGSAIIQLF